MSAYVVDPKTISRVLSWLKSEHHRGSYAYAADTAKRKLAAIEWDISNGEVADLGQAMYNMNVSAVSQRYPDSTEDNLPGTIEEDGRLVPYRYNWVDTGPMGAFKSLHCWLYQCSEGNVTETALYKAFREISDSIAQAIATGLPEYETAQWG